MNSSFLIALFAFLSIVKPAFGLPFLSLMLTHFGFEYVRAG